MDELLHKLLFLPIKHFPSYVTMKHLEELQGKFKHFYQQVNYEEKDNYNKALRKQIMASKLRDRIHLVQSCNSK